MDIPKLLALATRFKDVPEIAEAVSAAALGIAVLIDRIKANHARAEHMLTAGDRAEIDAVHDETLKLIDAFDAELAEGARQ